MTVVSAYRVNQTFPNASLIHKPFQNHSIRKRNNWVDDLLCTSDIRLKYFFANSATTNKSMLAAALPAHSLSSASRLLQWALGLSSSRPTVLIVERPKKKQNRYRVAVAAAANKQPAGADCRATQPLYGQLYML